MDVPHRVGVLVFDGVKMLDVAGPSGVFTEANRLGATYELVLSSVGAVDVTASTGMQISVDVDAAAAEGRCAGTLRSRLRPG